MIPYGIMSGQLCRRDGSILEIRMLDLSVEGFTFRLARNHDDQNMAEITGIRLSFLLRKGPFSMRMEAEDFTLEWETTKEYWSEYRLRTANESYIRAVRTLTSEYLGYIRGKLAGDDSALSEQLTGYPAAKEEEYASSYEKQKLQWLSEAAELRRVQRIEQGTGWGKRLRQFPEIGLMMDRPELYREYLETPNMDAFAENYLARLGLHSDADGDGPISITHLVIGSTYCHHLLPTRVQWELLLTHAQADGIQPVILLPPLGQCEWERLDPAGLVAWMQRLGVYLEVIVNDWGTARELRESPRIAHDRVSLMAGIHLCKYRKDTRLSWMHYDETEWEQMRHSAAEIGFYRQWLAEQGIDGMVWESCGYERHYPEGMKNMVQLPFYTMNTGTACTLAARCGQGNRGIQMPVENCPGYCSEKVFLYPEFLHMVGRYNSLIGFDREALWKEQRLTQMLTSGVQRVILQDL